MSNRGRGRGGNRNPVPPISNSIVKDVLNPVKAEATLPLLAPQPVAEPAAINVPNIPIPGITGGEETKMEEDAKPSWMKKRTREEEKGFKVAKRKRKNAQIVKAALPRTAISALTEIAIQMGVPGPVYENVMPAGDKASDGFYADALFQGVRHKGYGANHTKAKQAACELHIRDLIKANVAKLTPSAKKPEDVEMMESENPAKRPRIEEDSTPWPAIYAFAMSKYLETMQLGDAVLSVPSAGPPQFGAGPGFMHPRNPYRAPMPYQAARDFSVPSDDGFVNYSTGYPGSYGLFAGKPTPIPNTQSMQKPVNRMAPGPKIPSGMRPTAAKKLPENAVSMNPIMLLNQMRPDAAYSTQSDTGAVGENRFIMRVAVDGDSYEGNGAKVKDAKKQAAKRAVLAIYGIECMGN